MKIKNSRKSAKKTKAVTSTVMSPFVRRQADDGRFVEIIVTTPTGKIKYRVPKEPLVILTEAGVQTETLTG